MSRTSFKTALSAGAGLRCKRLGIDRLGLETRFGSTCGFVVLSILVLLGGDVNRAFGDERAEVPPNVLLIAVDDMNDWIGCLGGHPDASSPNIDRLAGMGTLFTNAHCQAPICNPSRTSIMYGVRPSTSGVYMNSPRPWAVPELKGRVTLPRHFAANGYRTLTAGKIYHGSGLPKGDFQKIGPRPGQRNKKLDKRLVPEQENGAKGLWDFGAQEYAEEKFADHQVATWAIDAIKEHAKQKLPKPFFIAAGFYRPHVPLYSPKRVFDQLSEEEIDLPKVKLDDRNDLPPIVDQVTVPPVAPKHQWFVESGRWREAVRSYLSCIRFTDEQVGRLLTTLEETSLIDNTVVVLYSDHGFFLGEKQRWAKQSLWERATRVPFVVVSPGKPNGQVCSRPVELLSIYPTLIELCGLSERDKLEGRSLVPLLESTDAEWPHHALTTHGRNNHAVRTDTHRYIRYRDGSEELYDLRTDPNEWNNIAKEPRSKALKTELAAYFPQRNAPDAKAPATASVSDPAKEQLAAIPFNAAERAERVELIRKLIKDLDADAFKVRNAASAKLAELACDELELIQEASKSTAPEVAMRAKQIIKKFSEYSHTVTDAVGNPIPGATVVIERKSGQLELKSNGCGHIDVPGYTRSLFMQDRPTITVTHKDYGVALGDFFPGIVHSRSGENRGIRLVDGMISLPLVHRSSAARERAASGTVVCEDGSPVSNARVTCRIVRTPGMGLMQASDVQTVFASGEGHFSIYLDQRRCTNRALPSKFIPPNSRYHLQVNDEDGHLFPWGGERTNRQTDAIVLRDPPRKFNVRFLDADGDEIFDDAVLRSFVVTYRGADSLCQLNGDFVKAGKLLPGSYDAVRRPVPGQRRAEMGPDKYATVKITSDSPADVTFQIAQAREVSGTVVDAKTGEPISNAFVVTLCSTSDTWLSMLSDDEWALLEKQSSDFGNAALKILRNIFGREMTATKSNSRGEFTIAESSAGTMHSVVAFTRKHVPMRESLYVIDKNLKEKKDNSRLTLFPAAFVTIPPNVNTRSYPRWVIHEGVTAEMTKLLRTAARDSNNQHAHYVRYLSRKEPTKVVVPAGTRMQIRLSPSGGRHSDLLIEPEFNLNAGENLELKPYQFQQRIPLRVRVVDESGKPVEGVAVRVSQDGSHYHIAANTDVNGEAVRMVDPNATGFCKVSGTFPGRTRIPDADKLKVKFSVGDVADETLVVEITQAQIDAILRSR